MNTISRIEDRLFQLISMFKRTKDSIYNFFQISRAKQLYRQNNVSILFGFAFFNLLLAMFTLRFLISMALFLFSLKCLIIFKFKYVLRSSR